MKTILSAISLAIITIFVATFSSCHYVPQGQKAFYYDVSSGKAVNQSDNPILPMGFNSAWGINNRFFTVQGTIMDYEFTKEGTGSSKYDETLRWNSKEGLVMSSEWKIYGRVSDPWKFFIHFGEQEYQYETDSHKDVKVYEALRESGKVLAQRINEIAAVTDAESIRTRPDLLKQQLLPYVRNYMMQFGFEVTDLLFMGNFQYPDGNVIVDARKQLTSLDSEIRGITQACSNKVSQVKVDTAQAAIEANKKISGAKRQASAMLAESSSLANALSTSIEQIGIDGTMRLKMAGLFGELTKDGAIPDVVLTENSVFASPFYPARSENTGPMTNRMDHTSPKPNIVIFPEAASTPK